MAYYHPAWIPAIGCHAICGIAILNTTTMVRILEKNVATVLILLLTKQLHEFRGGVIVVW
jgi:hypothetical protein